MHKKEKIVMSKANDKIVVMNKYGKGSVAYYGDINAETEKGDVRQE